MSAFALPDMMLLRGLARVVLLTGLALAISGGPVLAKDDEDPAKPLLTEDEGPLAVQMSTMLLPVTLKNGRTQKAAITPYFLGPSVEALSFLCRRAPKVREALFIVFGKNPIPLNADQEVEGEGSSALAVKAVNRALGKPAVRRAYIRFGSHPIAQGVAARLPGGSVGCQRISTLPPYLAEQEEIEARWEERRQKREERRQWREDIRKHRTLDHRRKSGE